MRPPFQARITREFVREKLFALEGNYLKAEYREKWTADRPTTGYCYLVSEALYHFVYTDADSYVINLGPGVGTHWWIQRGREIIDWTGDQFDFPVPYRDGRRATFFKGSKTTPRGTISRDGFLMAKYLGVVPKTGPKGEK